MIKQIKGFHRHQCNQKKGSVAVGRKSLKGIYLVNDSLPYPGSNENLCMAETLYPDNKVPSKGFSGTLWVYLTIFHGNLDYYVRVHHYL